MSLTTKQITTSDGVVRTITGKKTGDEYQVYQINGDVTDQESLREMAQIISCEFGCTRVVLPL